MHNPEFTTAQAVDLARHFLGPEWTARDTWSRGFLQFELIQTNYKDMSFPPLQYLVAGQTWRDAFRKAGIKLPFRPRYANVGRRVLVGSNEVAICTSNSYAERIAKSLNRTERLDV